ncbi:hypothetical protein N8382_08910, partial [Polaribacter sp.]|nr:hypothetical protein [Polaribacter sp.]
MKVEKVDSLESLFKNHITHKYLENNPLFSIENIEYQKHYRTDIVSSENLSFAIRNADIELLFVFIVYKHKTNSGMEFSNFGLP